MKQDEPKVSKNRLKKEAVVAEIKEKTEKAKAMVFTNYQGLTHKQIEDLKKRLKPLNADMAVTKNTLLKIALGKEADKADEESFNNPTAALFAYDDIVSPLKELAKTVKELGLPIIKFGIMDSKILTADEVKRLSTLPSREILLTQMVGQMKAPITGLVYALNWNLQKLAMTLKAIEAKKA